MKTLIALLTLTFAINANAGAIDTTLSCLTSEGNLVVYNGNYGELSEMDPQGRMLLEYDDGYDASWLNLESLPPQEQITVWHHEETDIVVLAVSRVAYVGDRFKGRYLNTEGSYVSVTCMN